MSFYAATLDAGMTPAILEKATASADTWPKGALLLMNSSGEWAECGADPTVVGAVALSGNGNSLPFGQLRTDGFPTGRCQGVLVKNNQPFLAKYVGTLGTPGTNYGVVVDSDGDWKVDFNDTTADVVLFVRNMATDNLGLAGLVEVVFLDAVVQQLG